MRTKQQELASKVAEENLVKGVEFLSESGKKDGVVTTET
jgi:hypothetical protein